MPLEESPDREIEAMPHPKKVTRFNEYAQKLQNQCAKTGNSCSSFHRPPRKNIHPEFADELTEWIKVVLPLE
jgi:hypothetical protein